MPSVTVMVFTMHPLSVIPLNIKQLNIFPVPSLLWLVPARNVRLTPRLRLRLIPLSSTPDTTVIPTPTDTVLADTMAVMVDTPAVDTTVMDSVDSVMPTMVKQRKKHNIAIVKKSTKKLPSDIVLKISSRNQKRITLPSSKNQPKNCHLIL